MHNSFVQPNPLVVVVVLVPILFLFCHIIIISHALVPYDKTFTYVNVYGNTTPEVKSYTYDMFASYRCDLSISNFPFTLCFYNTTPNAFVLAMAMGDDRRDSNNMRWVWEANPHRPVREGAALSFYSDGDLVLSDVDATVVWQAGTADMDVVGLDLLPNGNLVLYDNAGRFVWQSFDYPTNTLLVGQTLRPHGPNKLLTRRKSVNPNAGPAAEFYSFFLMQSSFVMYLISIDSRDHAEPLIYFRDGLLLEGKSETLVDFKLYSKPNTRSAYSFKLGLALTAEQEGTNNLVDSVKNIDLSSTKYNSTFRCFGWNRTAVFNVHTYYGYDTEFLDPCEVSYKFFDNAECGLPKKCGKLGVCNNNQCVACPTPSGLRGWSESCAPPAAESARDRCNGGARPALGSTWITSK